MKQVFTLFVLFSVVSFSYPPEVTGQVDQKDADRQVQSLPHEMTPEEESRRHEIGMDFTVTPPPTGPVRNVAEFDMMQSVLIRYPFGISYSIIAEMSEDTRVLTIVANQTQENTVRTNYINNGVNLSHCDFIHAPTESYWTRDYGPWFIFDGNGDPGIVDFPYNRPRPNDDEIPVKVAQYLGIDLSGMDITHTGGNYMTDGMGISSSTELVWDENPSLTHAQIDQMMEDYLGIQTYHVVPDPNNTYIDHIDCWGKFLDVDKVLIREVPPSHSQYDEIEATAAYYAAQTSSYGLPYEVYRVYTPNNEPYTNSLILNRKVLVPITGSQWDDEAIQTYQNAMPGYEVLGFTGSWESTDALHCRTKGIADIGMLYIRHVPLQGNVTPQSQYPINAVITAHSGQSIYADSTRIIYRINGGAWQEAPLVHTSGSSYSGNIPGQEYGSGIAYYLYSADASGRNATHPFIGAPDPHIFYVGEPLYPDIAVSPSSIQAEAPQGGSDTEQFTIFNNGLLSLSFMITCNTSVQEQFSYTVSNSPSKYAWDYNTYTELGWTDRSVPEAGTVATWEITYTWSTDNWPSEGSFRVESPSGTTAVIASGNTNGTFTVSLNNFNGEEMQGNWKLWIQDSYGDGGHQATAITMKITREVQVVSWLSVNPVMGTTGASSSTVIDVLCDASGLTPGTYNGTVLISSNDPDSPEIGIPVEFNVTSGYLVDMKVLLEGPFNGAAMTSLLNTGGYIPLNQPYNVAPWYYAGTEAVASIPDPNITDWILIEYRDAPDAASALPGTIIAMQAAFLKNDGKIVALDGSGMPVFSEAVTEQLFAVIRHRNHLDIMSANPLSLAGNVYSYDFTNGAGQAYGGSNAQHELSAGIWGMIGGDGDADGQIGNGDKLDVWSLQAGSSGYKTGDFNLDIEVNNGDKNDVWVPNSGLGSQVP
ncbi:MAG: agmatine deiminase family protein [Bacteroidales bacterium]|nr:agmatine deiminase family protein [Bacteroidales bacterium]